jgi:hypothetical protein
MAYEYTPIPDGDLPYILWQLVHRLGGEATITRADVDATQYDNCRLHLMRDPDTGSVYLRAEQPVVDADVVDEQPAVAAAPIPIEGGPPRYADANHAD